MSKNSLYPLSFADSLVVNIHPTKNGKDASHVEHYRAALGYKLAKSWWRQGLMTEALKQVIAYRFEGMGLKHIEALVDCRNIASCKLLEKNCFVRGQSFENTNGIIKMALWILLCIPSCARIGNRYQAK